MRKSAEHALRLPGPGSRGLNRTESEAAPDLTARKKATNAGRRYSGGCEGPEA